MHTDAPTAAATDWRQILALYDQLLTLAPSPVVSLNRAVAVAEVDGPGPALAIVDDIELDGYYVLHSIRADLLARLGRAAEAAAEYAAPPSRPTARRSAGSCSARRASCADADGLAAEARLHPAHAAQPALPVVGPAALVGRHVGVRQDQELLGPDRVQDRGRDLLRGQHAVHRGLRRAAARADLRQRAGAHLAPATWSAGCW